MEIYSIMQVEAWAGDEEGSWNYNNVWNIGSVAVKETDDLKIIFQNWLDENVGINWDVWEIRDDGYDVEVVNRETSEPIFCICE